MSQYYAPFEARSFASGYTKTKPVHQSLEVATETITQDRRPIYQKQVRDVDELEKHLIEPWSGIQQVH